MLHSSSVKGGRRRVDDDRDVASCGGRSFDEADSDHHDTKHPGEDTLEEEDEDETEDSEDEDSQGEVEPDSDEEDGFGSLLDDIRRVEVATFRARMARILARTAPSPAGAPSGRVFCDDEGYTALHWAALEDRGDLAALIVDEMGVGADVPNQRSPSTLETPLHWAAMNGHVRVAELLLARGARLDAVDWVGNRATHVAAGHNQAVFLLWAASQGACLDDPNDFGQTPLHIACAAPSFDAAWTLIECGSTVNLADGSGRTPLHCAAAAASAPLLRMLVANGAETLVFDGDGRSPAMLLSDDGKSRSMLEQASLFGGWRYAPGSVVATPLRRAATFAVPLIAVPAMLLLASTAKWYVTAAAGLALMASYSYMAPFWTVAPRYSPLAPVAFTVAAWLWLRFVIALWYRTHLLPWWLVILVDAAFAAVGCSLAAVGLRSPGYVARQSIADVLAVHEQGSEGIQRNGLLFCPGCRGYKRREAKHCTVCNRCVQHFDHHCPWANACVGARNAPIFVAFLAATTTYLALVFLSSAASMRMLVPSDAFSGAADVFGREDGSQATGISLGYAFRYLNLVLDLYAFEVVHGAFAAGWLLWTALLLRDALVGVMQGSTTYERILQARTGVRPRAVAVRLWPANVSSFVKRMFA